MLQRHGVQQVIGHIAGNMSLGDIMSVIYIHASNQVQHIQSGVQVKAITACVPGGQRQT